MYRLKDTFNVPVSYLLPVIEACQHHNIDVNRLLAKHGVSASILADKSESMDVMDYTSIINTAATWTKQVGFGLEVGKCFTIDWGREVAYLLARQEKLINVYPALEYLMDIQNRGVHTHLDIKGQTASHSVELDFDSLINCGHLNQLIITFYHKAFLGLLKEKWVPIQVNLRGNHNADLKKLEQHFSCKVSIGMETTSIEFNKTLLNESYHYQLNASKDVLKDISHILRDADFLVPLIKKYIRYNLEDGRFSKEHIANMLCLHPRVLQNYLSCRGFSYRGLLSDVRKEMAAELLSNSTLPINIIANQLGYENSKTFIQAFRGWYQMPPSAWRSNLPS